MNTDGNEMVLTASNHSVDDNLLRQAHAKVYPVGTIVFPKVGGALLTNKKRVLGVPATFDNNVMGVIPRGVDGEWLFLRMQTVDLRLLANTQALPSIRQSDVSALQIEVPEHSEQRRTAEALRNQLAAVETARRAVEAQLAVAHRLPSAVLDATFAGGEAEGWPRQRLGTLLLPRNDIVHPRDKPKGRARFVGLEHIEPHTGRRLGAVEVELAELTGRKARFFIGDVVYGYLRPYLNKVWIAEFAGLCSVDQYVYRVAAERADIGFLAWFLRSPTYLGRAPVDVSPGQLPRIRMEEVAAVEIGLPPLDTQRAIAARLDAELAATARLLATLEARLDDIEKLPAALLRESFGAGGSVLVAHGSNDALPPEDGVATESVA